MSAAISDTTITHDPKDSTTDTRRLAMSSLKPKSKSTHWLFASPHTQGTLIGNLYGLAFALALAALSISAIKLESNIYISSGIWGSAGVVLCVFRGIPKLELVIAVLVSMILMERVPRRYSDVSTEDVMFWLVSAQYVYTAVCLAFALVFRLFLSAPGKTQGQKGELE